MKKLVATLAAILVTAAAYGQGAVNFENYTIPNAIINNFDGTGLGPNGRAQLYFNNSPLGTPQPFEASTPGQFFAGTINVPAAVSSSQVFDVRAWVDATSWEAATIRNPQGRDLTKAVNIGGDNVPPPTVEFTGFALVPEPSTIALGILGAAALLFRRRKK